MKKLLITTAALLLAIIMNAQEIRFGVKGGLNIGSYKTEFDGQNDKSDSKVSFYLGGRAEYGFSENMSAQGELLFQGYGGKYNEDTYSTDITIREISFPVVFKYYVIPQKFSFNAGLSFGFIVSAKVDWEDSFDNTSGTEDMNDEVKTINLGFTFGAEYRFTDNIFADIRYNAGLSNLYDGEGSGKVKCSVLQIGVGYRF